MLRIGLDIDDVIADWHGGYIKRFGNYPVKDWVITRNVKNILIHERNFWLNLPIKNMPNFTPRLFCSARINSKNWTKTYLKKNGLNSPLYQVNGYHISKYDTLKGKVDVFIDDSLKNFIDLNTKGIPCLLMDSPLNQSWGEIGRIYSLKLEEIESTYNDFIKRDIKNLIEEIL